MINNFNKHFLSKNIFWQRTWKIIFFLNTVFLLFLMRERDHTVTVPWTYRDRFRLFVSKRYCVPTRSFLGVPDRSPFLTVHRSWPFLTVPDRSWPFTDLDRFWAFLVEYSQKKIFLTFCYLIRVEHEKCSEMCVRIVKFGQKLKKWDYFYVENFITWKNSHMSLTHSLTPCQSVKECPKILRIIQETNFDMGFQKINMRSWSEKVDFFHWVIFRRTAT
jgi:hypothetical protein